ncbi:MAG: YheC/YheD family protein, partial [Bacillota bacterium]|nr:YheC/YheD family protein [Bacillota bacterium]
RDEASAKKMVLPHRLADELGLRAGTTRLRIGQSEASAQVELSKQDSRPQRLFLSSDLINSLHVSPEDYLYMWWDKNDNSLRVGPVLGVMGSRRSKTGGVFGPTTEIIRNCVCLARRRGMLAYAFSPGDIDWESKSVRGWVWTGAALRMMRCPLPDIVYDRVASRRSETSKRMTAAKESLLSIANLQYYNRVFLNKWDVHKMLELYPKLQKHLPPTQELVSPKNLEIFLKKHSVVFVKPTQGSLGAGILRIARSSKGFVYRLTRLNQPDSRGRAATMAGMIEVAERLLKQDQYVVQRGIRLAHINGAPFDIRVLLQKSKRNHWTVQSMVARVAQPGNVISNLADGGQIINPRRAIAAVFGPSIKPSLMTLRIRRIAKAAALAIEKEIGFEFAEMGMDLAVDTSAKIWIIEANSRPGRQTNETAQRRVSMSVVRLVRFLRSRGLQ